MPYDVTSGSGLRPYVARLLSGVRQGNALLPGFARVVKPLKNSDLWSYDVTSGFGVRPVPARSLLRWPSMSVPNLVAIGTAVWTPSSPDTHTNKQTLLAYYIYIYIDEFQGK